jgi:hypothetical protein
LPVYGSGIMSGTPYWPGFAIGSGPGHESGEPYTDPALYVRLGVKFHAPRL